MADSTPPKTASVMRPWPLLIGLILALSIQLIPLPEGVSREAWLVASLGVLMAVWWASEAIPIAATALIPLAIFPLLGLTSMRAVASPYASPTVMLLLGGFILALGIERWNLHARIALNIVAAFGARPGAMVLGFMVASAALSMWISNTATTLMMIPIAMKVAEALDKKGISARLIAPALALGIAYACSIGGVATPVGTPTNLIGMAYLENTFQRTIDFPTWMLIGIPCTALIVPAIWFILTRMVFTLPKAENNPAGHAIILAERDALGPISTPEWRMALTFGFIAVLWMGQPIWNDLLGQLSQILSLGVTFSVSNAQIAMLGALMIFLIPAGAKTQDKPTWGVLPLMDWASTARLPWNVLILFGGGLSLAAALQSTGLADWLGSNLTLFSALPMPVLVFILAVIVVFLTELTSNVATVSAFLPVLGALAGAAGVPAEILIVTVAISASCAFMLPVATAPNAIVYASGEVTMGQMIRAGLRINLVAAPIIAVIVSVIGPLVF
ncbi:SLC13 family permease [Woodsholea maritima]|uniref:SLC13 family permease n=1 Tax=Woodsholea maritima TaxID=240237 RepID=UPI00037E9D81|nr:SLC13 family permease [Woodsholea maritima]